jgi:hypothetical protein
MARVLFSSAGLVYLAVLAISADGNGSEAKRDKAPNGRHLFAHETWPTCGCSTRT